MSGFRSFQLFHLWFGDWFLRAVSMAPNLSSCFSRARFHIILTTSRMQTKKKPLFSFRLKLINPMTRAKVSNQGGTVNWCISLSDCSCNKRVQSQKVQRQNCLHLSSSARPWNYLHQSNFLAIKIFFFHSTFYMVSNWSFSLK